MGTTAFETVLFPRAWLDPTTGPGSIETVIFDLFPCCPLFHPDASQPASQDCNYCRTSLKKRRTRLLVKLVISSFPPSPTNTPPPLSEPKWGGKLPPLPPYAARFVASVIKIVLKFILAPAPLPACFKYRSWNLKPKPKHTKKAIDREREKIKHCFPAGDIPSLPCRLLSPRHQNTKPNRSGTIERIERSSVSV